MRFFSIFKSLSDLWVYFIYLKYLPLIPAFFGILSSITSSLPLFCIFKDTIIIIIILGAGRMYVGATGLVEVRGQLSRVSSFLALCWGSMSCCLCCYTVYSRLAGAWTPRRPSSLPFPSDGPKVTDVYHGTWLFTWALGVACIIRLHNQHLRQRGHSSSLTSSFLNSPISYHLNKPISFI